MGGYECFPRRIFFPAILGLDENHRGLVPIFGLPGYVADGLVQQDRHLFALVARSRGLDFDLRRMRGGGAAETDGLGE